MRASVGFSGVEEVEQTTKESEVDASMRAARNALAKTRNYCAFPGLAKLLTWIDDGAYKRLVWRDDIADVPRANVNQIPNAHLTLMVQIDEQDCWLAAHGAWRGPSTEAPTFADITLSCSGATPPITYLFDDFQNAMSNIDDIIRMAGDHRPSYKGLIVNDTGEKRIVVNHSPFVRIGIHESKESKILVTDNAYPYKFNVTDWPAHSRLARESRKNIKETHVLQPLPATDIQGRLVHPADYERMFAGGIAEVTFSIWKGQRRDENGIWGKLELIRSVAQAKAFRETIAARKKFNKERKAGGVGNAGSA